MRIRPIIRIAWAARKVIVNPNLVHFGESWETARHHATEYRCDIHARGKSRRSTLSRKKMTLSPQLGRSLALPEKIAPMSPSFELRQNLLLQPSQFLWPASIVMVDRKGACSTITLSVRILRGGTMRQITNQSFVLLLTFSLLTSQTLAANPGSLETAQAPVIRNVELGEGGVARGVVVNTEGRACPHAKVEVHANRTVFQTTTDEAGRFQISGLTGGSCVVKAGDEPYGCRLWANQTAPPKSLHTFVVVDPSQPVVRGQDCIGENCDDYYAGDSGGVGYLNSLGGMTGAQMVGFGLLAAGVTVAIVLAAQDDGNASN